MGLVSRRDTERYSRRGVTQFRINAKAPLVKGSIPPRKDLLRNHISLARREEQVRFQPVLARVQVVVAAAHRKQLGVIAAFHNEAPSTTRIWSARRMVDSR